MRSRNALLFALLILVTSPVWAQESVPEVALQMLEEANRHREGGRTEEAIARYREVLDIAPSLLDAYVGLGAIYHRAKDYEQANAVFASGLERFPDDATLLFNAAATEMRLGRMELALGYVDRGIEVNDDDAAIHSLRGTISRRLGRLDDAAKSFERAVELDSKSARAQYNLGNVLHQLNRKQDALEAYRKAIRIDRSFQPAHYNLGAVLFELEQFDDALQAYEIALAPIEEDFEKGRKVASGHARAYLNLGAIYLRRQSWDRALDAYEKAVRLDATQAAAHYNVGYIQYRLGNAVEAYSAYQTAVELDAELPLSYLHMGLIDYASGRMEEAAYWLEAGMPRFQPAERSQAVVTLAQAYQALGNTERAEASYRNALKDNPADITALVNLGRLLRVRGALDEARALLEQASANVLDSSGVAIELAALARASGDVGRERALYEEALRRDGHRVEMWPVRVNLVGALVRSGAIERALAELDVLQQQLPAISAGSPELAHHLRTTRALLLARNGDYAGARSGLTAVVQEQPGSLYAINGLAAMDAMAGDTERAAGDWSRLAAGSGGTPLDAIVRANLGQTLWLAGRHDDARAYLLESAEAFPENVSVRAALGEIELARRDYPAAGRELRAAVETCRGSISEARRATSLVELALGGSIEAVCQRAETALGLTLVASTASRMHSPGRGAMRSLDEALGYPLDAQTRAQALLMRATLALQQFQNARARADLEQALAGSLPEGLVAAAHNNLGVALYRTGATVQATEHFQRARARMSRLAPATLNLAIASHDDKQPERALTLYEEYLAIGGERSDDAQSWAESIRRIYR